MFFQVWGIFVYSFSKIGPSYNGEVDIGYGYRDSLYEPVAAFNVVIFCDYQLSLY
jgi:hypothetical protein